MTPPLRIQLSRAKGFNLQAHSLALNGLPAVNVDRTTKWGNPYQGGHDGDGDRAYLVGLFRALAEREDGFRPDIEDLRGKNLACWCKESPCHADVLLELANTPEESGK